MEHLLFVYEWHRPSFAKISGHVPEEHLVRALQFEGVLVFWRRMSLKRSKLWGRWRFPPCLLSFSSSQWTPSSLLNPPLPRSSIPLSLPHAHFSLLAATRFEKIAVYFDPRSGWRPHLVAAGNSISLPHADEWVTTFRAPVNMCLTW